MSRVTVFVIASLFIASCSTAGVIGRQDFLALEPGMTKAEVISRLGEPGNRTFRDSVEALHYCRTGLATDEYFTVWLSSGFVRAVSTENAVIAYGSCGGRYPDTDWARAPAEVRVLLQPQP